MNRYPEDAPTRPDLKPLQEHVTMPPTDETKTAPKYDPSEKTYDPKIATDLAAFDARLSALEASPGVGGNAADAAAIAALVDRVSALETANAKLVADLGGHAVPPPVPAAPATK